MRFTRLVALLFAALLLVSQGNGEAQKREVDERRFLGEQLLDSIKDDNIVAVLRSAGRRQRLCTGLRLKAPTLSSVGRNLRGFRKKCPSATARSLVGSSL